MPRPIIEAFDAWLTERSLCLDAIVIGGAALALLGVIGRQTRDVDILDPELSEEMREASREFAVRLRGEGVELEDDWLNDGPMQLADVLPDGWRSRLRAAFTGTSLTFTTLGRTDLLMSKLFALCDRGIDLADCVAMAPTPREIEEAEPWLAEQDANPMWPAHVRATLDDLRERLGRGI